jgi:hypothetical protein
MMSMSFRPGQVLDNPFFICTVTNDFVDWVTVQHASPMKGKAMKLLMVENARSVNMEPDVWPCLANRAPILFDQAFTGEKWYVGTTGIRNAFYADPGVTVSYSWMWRKQVGRRGLYAPTTDSFTLGESEFDSLLGLI